MLALPVSKTAWKLSSSSINSGKPFATIGLSRRGQWSVRITPGLRLRPEHLKDIDGFTSVIGETSPTCQRVLAKAGRA